MLDTTLSGAWIIASSGLTTSSINWGDAVMHILIVALSVVVLTVSLLAYKRRRSRRYLFLTAGFFFIFMSQLATLLEVAFLSNALLIIPSIGLHLSHVFDFLTLIFFLLGLTGYAQDGGHRKTISEPFSGAQSKTSIVEK